MDQTIGRLLAGDQRALSSLITLVERGDPRGLEVLEKVHPNTGKAHCIGVTGPPGGGKSTIVDGLVGLMRGEGASLGIIAVDPTSPYSGGSFLGDRIRMQRHSADPGVFIRSAATRDGVGGIPRIVRGAIRLMDASGKDLVLVETAGVGQTDLGIMGVADTVIVILVPEAGDIIQTLKAGLIEIADIYVVNKADRDSLDQMVSAIKTTLNMGAPSEGWSPPVLATQAPTRQGLPELHSAIKQHRDFLQRTSLLEQRRRFRRAKEFQDTIQDELGRRLQQFVAEDSAAKSLLEQVEQGEKDPYSSALKVLDCEHPSLGPFDQLLGK